MISQQLQLQVLIKSSSLCTKLFMNDYFRIYTNNDVIGVETGAALKISLQLVPALSMD